MSNKNFLEEKFIELNKLKSMLITYPEEYKGNILQVMDKVCNQINSYLNEVTFHNKKRDNELIELTMEELGEYNGLNGMPAYVAINGTIYDVSAIPQWTRGVHFGVKAGLDNTDTFKKCHSTRTLDKLPIVGHIKDGQKSTFC